MHIKHWRLLLKNRFGKLGLTILALFLIVSLISPFVAKNPTNRTNSTFKPPSFEHLLGTNDVGQDILSRLICGVRTSVLVAVGVAFISTLLSVLVGASAALIGGLYEQIVMRVVDIFLVMPSLIVLILIAAFVKPSIWMLILLIAVLRWQGGARIIRAQILSLKEQMHISAARTFGANRIYILIKHIVPELAPILVVSLIYRARMAVFMEAGLAFLGIAEPTMISWGTMIHHSLKFYYLDVWKWWLVPTGFAFSLLILSFTFIGFSLEEIIEPRLRKKDA